MIKKLYLESHRIVRINFISLENSAFTPKNKNKLKVTSSITIDNKDEIRSNYMIIKEKFAPLTVSPK